MFLICDRWHLEITTSSNGILILLGLLLLWITCHKAYRPFRGPEEYTTRRQKQERSWYLEEGMVPFFLSEDQSGGTKVLSETERKIPTICDWQPEFKVIILSKNREKRKLTERGNLACTCALPKPLHDFWTTHVLSRGQGAL